MTVRIPTHELVGLLTDLALTAADPADSGATAAVLLHTVRGYIGADPGQTDLLVGTSTNGMVVGHCHTTCYGQIEPMLWPIAAVKDVIAVLKPKGKEKEHAVTLSRDGDVLAVAEDPDLFGERLKMTFTGLDHADFPHEMIRRLLAEIRTALGDDAPPMLPRTDFTPSLLAPFLVVAKRRNVLLETYRWHQRLPVSVQIGAWYRGVIQPNSAWKDEDRSVGVAPAGDVYPLAAPS